MGAPAESEEKDLITGLIGQGQVGIALLNIAAQTETEGSSDFLPLTRFHTFVIPSELLIGAVYQLGHSADVGGCSFLRLVPCAVKAQCYAFHGHLLMSGTSVEAMQAVSCQTPEVPRYERYHVQNLIPSHKDNGTIRRNMHTIDLMGCVPPTRLFCGGA